MKKKVLVSLTAAMMILSSTNALASTKNYSSNRYSNNSFNRFAVKYLNGYDTNFNNKNCIENSDISDLLNSCFPDCTNIWQCINGNNGNCNPNRPVFEKPENPNDDKPNKPNKDNSGDNNENENNNENTSESRFAAEVVRLVNIERNKEGLSPLKSDSTVQSAAQIRAREIVTDFSHTRPDGSECFTALQAVGAKYSGAGENIAYGQKTPQEVVNAWMNSPGHRANIMNGNFTTIGVGCYKSGNTYYWSQFFTY